MNGSEHSNREIFALDIGTRSIIGVVGVMEQRQFRILAQSMVEHDSRAMYDGQVHDIPRAAEAVIQVKANLEEQLGRRLTGVAIAAAGRSLQTKRCSAREPVDENVEIGDELIRRLELAALREAQDELEAAASYPESYYCVGHYPVGYFLDDLAVTNLLGHRGRTIGVEIIATFVPASVVNGLFSVLRRAELEPVSLTLEPIAAMEVAIPSGMRLLNLALVDVGAGTSDIAITRDGTVIAYGMVPVAGDELTEAIVEGCLVDFDTAERIKRQLGQDGDIVYNNILGERHTASPAEILSLLDPAVDRLADEISKVILELNGEQSPKSVICVGGGVQIPGLTARIAARLGIQEKLVGIRGRDMIQVLEQPMDDPLSGPSGVTVVGIGVLALEKVGYSFIEVLVNDEKCRLFNNRNLNVAAALSQIRFDPRRLVARHGRDLHFNLNGREELVLGELSRPAQLYVNGVRGNLQTPVRDGDRIEVQEAVDGRDARALVKDYFTGDPVRFELNGHEVTSEPLYILNDLVVAPETEIQEGDRLHIQRQPTVRRLARSRGLDLDSSTVLVNGSPVSDDYLIRDGDQVTMMSPTDGENGVLLPPPPGISVNVNGEEVFLAGNQEHMFIEILNYLNMDLTRLKSLPVLKLNGNDAGYTDILQAGDEIVVTWETFDEEN